MLLEVKIYDTPAGGICASQDTFSSIYLNLICLHILYMFAVYLMSRNFILLSEQACEITQGPSVFKLMYGSPCVRDYKPGALASGYHPHTQTDHTLTCLLHI